MKILVFLAGVLAMLAAATFADLVSEEARARLEALPLGLLRLAGRRLRLAARRPSAAIWEDVYENQWLSELRYVLQRHQGRPITRLYQGICFSLGLWWVAPRIARDWYLADLADVGRQVIAVTECRDRAEAEWWAAELDFVERAAVEDRAVRVAVTRRRERDAGADVADIPERVAHLVSVDLAARIERAAVAVRAEQASLALLVQRVASADSALQRRRHRWWPGWRRSASVS